MTAPDDLARTLAEHREVKPWVCLCGWWSAIQEPDGSDYARHLASVVSRRDTDLRTRVVLDFGHGITPAGFELVVKGLRDAGYDWIARQIDEQTARALDADTHEVAP